MKNIRFILCETNFACAEICSIVLLQKSSQRIRNDVFIKMSNGKKRLKNEKRKKKKLMT